MSRPRNLYVLQRIDSQIDEHNRRLKEIAEALGDKQELMEAQTRLATAQAEMDASQKLLKEAEQKVREQRQKIQRTESTLYGGKVRNPKELADLQDEAEALKRYLTVLEDRQLELMLDLDDKKDILRTAQERLDQLQSKRADLESLLSAEQADIHQAIKTLMNDRQKAVKLIPAEDLAVYDRLRISRAGLAVARINQRACSACGATLSAALYQVSRSPSQITLCETCGRILYAD